MKYKVGDKVRIRKDIRTSCATFERAACVQQMLQYAGREVTIVYVGQASYRVRENTWYWSDYMLEDICELKVGEKVLCKSYNGINSYEYYFIADIGECYIVANENLDYFKGNMLESNHITTWKKEYVFPITKEKPKEFTLQEIANKLGITVEELRIKK